MADNTLDIVRKVARGEMPPEALQGICPRHGYFATYREPGGRLWCPACETLAAQDRVTVTDASAVYRVHEARREEKRR